MSVLDLFKLDGKVALVTGAGSGIGRAYAEALSESGAAVACADVDASLAQEVTSSLQERAVAIRADVSDEAQAREMIERTVSELGRLDIALANAGIAGELEPAFPEATLETWQSVIDVNLTGA